MGIGMGEPVPVRCPECLRTQRYAAPAFPCACGTPVVPPVVPGATGEPVTHRNWTDEWVVVRCVSCGREDEWPHPELGCTCGAVLRIPVRGPGSDPGSAAPSAHDGGTGAIAGARTGDAAIGIPATETIPGPWSAPDGTPGAEAPSEPGSAPGSGSASAPPSAPGGAAGAVSSLGTWDGPGAGTGSGSATGTGTGTGTGSATGSGTGPGPVPGAGGQDGPWTGEPEARNAPGRADADDDPAPGPWAGTAGALWGGHGDGHRPFAERYPSHIPLPPTAPHPVPPRPSYRPVTIRTARDAVAAAAGYLRWLGFRDVVQPEERSAPGVDLRAPGLVAQVDPTTRPATLRAVECLWLHGLSASSVSVFFSLAGYTAEARSRADELGIPLFVLDLTGTPQPLNAPADHLIAAGA
ncbi:hypothetical protein [Streptomyces sp. ISL-36]|uniref:hypothetical protein n=1 Tax=Streptomyces sp. ISL-36 TaxID=2819182 RepID=UPI0035A84F94